MKKIVKRIFLMVLMISLSMPGVFPTVQAEAAEATKVTLKIGETRKFTLNDSSTINIKKIKWSSKDRLIVKVVKGSKNGVEIKGMSTGKTTVVGKVYATDGTMIGKLKIKATVADSVGSSGNVCSVCNGLGVCGNCVAGQCYLCSGSGTSRCTSCGGLRRCLSCSGSGYSYTGVGIAFRKVRCTSCRGSGSCRTCGGTGNINCTRCSGTGTCRSCFGNYRCLYCNGTGLIN